MTQTAEHPVILRPVAPKAITPTIIAIVGNGNIGVQAALHVARMPQVDGMVLIDKDSFSAGNVSQIFSSAEIGQAKAIVTARRARRIRPGGDLHVEAIVARVADIPLGKLRASVILGCVDSPLARSDINQLAWRLGVPWIDAGIQAQGALVRIQVHVPSFDGACIQCAWGVKDFERLSFAYTCEGRLREPPPTNAPSALGATAAGLQVLECARLLNGDQSLAGKQLIYELRHHNYYVNSLRRNAACRFDHRVWSIEKAPASVRTVGDLIEHGRKLFGGEPPAAISAQGKSWVTRLACRLCGRQVNTLRLQGRLSPRLRSCEQCGGEMHPVGFHLRPRLEMRSASGRLLARPLRHLGLCAGDVVTLTGARGVRHVELCQSQQAGGN
jgi:molybdopterin/thiamine biosynthesis adenylyltransferase